MTQKVKQTSSRAASSTGLLRPLSPDARYRGSLSLDWVTAGVGGGGMPLFHTPWGATIASGFAFVTEKKEGWWVKAGAPERSRGQGCGPSGGSSAGAQQSA